MAFMGHIGIVALGFRSVMAALMSRLITLLGFTDGLL
jgi:hypothetical protein